MYRGGRGGDSIFSTPNSGTFVYATGGGGGGTRAQGQQSGGPGGNGGGANNGPGSAFSSGSDVSSPDNIGPGKQGNGGGTSAGTESAYGSGGGGGASASGTDGSATKGGDGADGIQVLVTGSLIPSDVGEFGALNPTTNEREWYCGGGGGASQLSPLASTGAGAVSYTHLTLPTILRV